MNIKIIHGWRLLYESNGDLVVLDQAADHFLEARWKIHVVIFIFSCDHNFWDYSILSYVSFILHDLANPFQKGGRIA